MEHRPKEEILRPGLDREVFERICESIQSIDFGSVEVTIHNRRIVQIERREKFRLEPKTKSSE